MRSIRQMGENKWAFALVVSLFFHGLAVLGLSRCSAAKPIVPALPVHIDMVAIGDESESPGINLDARSFDPPHPAKINQTNHSAKPETVETSPGHSSFASLSNPFNESPAPDPGGTSPDQGLVGGNGPGTSVFFGSQGKGRRVVYLIDCSGSMGKNGALAAARAELANSLRSLPSDTRFQVVVYHDLARPLLPGRPGWLEPTSDLVREAIQALWRLPAEGPTNHAAGLRAGLRLQPDLLYFLTDADDLTSEHLRLALELDPRHRTAIHAIELTLINRDRPHMPMQILARLSRGQYQAVDLAHWRP